MVVYQRMLKSIPFIMSLTVSQGVGLTVITITSNPRSKWPVLCQILGSLCCSAVSLKEKPRHVHTALRFYSLQTISLVPFWLGGAYLVVGIFCVLHAKFPTTVLGCISQKHRKLKLIMAPLVSMGLRCTSAYNAFGKRSPAGHHSDSECSQCLFPLDLMMENNIATLNCNSYCYHSQTGYSDLPFKIKKQHQNLFT